MKLILKCPECRIVLVEIKPGNQKWMPLVGESDGGPVRLDPDSLSRARLAYSILRHHLICDKDEFAAEELTDAILYEAFKDGFTNGVEIGKRDMVSSLKDPRSISS